MKTLAVACAFSYFSSIGLRYSCPPVISFFVFTLPRLPLHVNEKRGRNCWCWISASWDIKNENERLQLLVAQSSSNNSQQIYWRILIANINVDVTENGLWQLVLVTVRLTPLPPNDRALVTLLQISAFTEPPLVTSRSQSCSPSKQWKRSQEYLVSLIRRLVLNVMQTHGLHFPAYT